MIRKEDLSEKLLNSYIYNLNRVGKDEAWGEVAMNEKPLEVWEKYQGFNLFQRESFIAQVNRKMGGRNTALTTDMLLEQQSTDYNDLKADITSINHKVDKIEEDIDNLKLRVGKDYEPEFVSMRKTINDLRPMMEQLSKVALIKQEDYDKLIQRIEMMWKRYLADTGTEMRLYDLERRIAILEEGGVCDDGED